MASTHSLPTPPVLENPPPSRSRLLDFLRRFETQEQEQLTKLTTTVTALLAFIVRHEPIGPVKTQKVELFVEILADIRQIQVRLNRNPRNPEVRARVVEEINDAMINFESHEHDYMTQSQVEVKKLRAAFAVAWAVVESGPEVERNRSEVEDALVSSLTIAATNEGPLNLLEINLPEPINLGDVLLEGRTMSCFVNGSNSQQDSQDNVEPTNGSTSEQDPQDEVSSLKGSTFSHSGLSGYEMKLETNSGRMVTLEAGSNASLTKSYGSSASGHSDKRWISDFFLQLFKDSRRRSLDPY